MVCAGRNLHSATVARGRSGRRSAPSFLTVCHRPIERKGRLTSVKDKWPLSVSHAKRRGDMIMSLRNTPTAYGWVAIALHWVSAIAVVTLYLLGERLEEAASRAEELTAMRTHVSVGVLLIAFLAARLLWSVSQPAPRGLGRSAALRITARVVQGLFLAMIAILIISGPLVIWSTGSPIKVFDWFAIPSPFPVRIDWLHEAGELIHKAASKLFWPLIVLHVLGGLKHLVIDRDRTLQRMLWVSRQRSA